MGQVDLGLIVAAIWSFIALVMSMVLEFKAGDQRIEWPNPDRLFQRSRYHGNIRKLYYSFVAWCVLGLLGAVGLFVLILVRAILERI